MTPSIQLDPISVRLGRATVTLFYLKPRDIAAATLDAVSKAKVVEETVNDDYDDRICRHGFIASRLTIGG
jgi:hypothetical protein